MVNTKEIRKQMIDKDLTYVALGEVLKLAPTTVRQKIANVRPMSLDEAEKLQTVLGISDDEFCLYFFSAESRNATQ